MIFEHYIIIALCVILIAVSVVLLITAQKLKKQGQKTQIISGTEIGETIISGKGPTPKTLSQIGTLQRMKDDGIITDAEYKQAYKKIMLQE